MSDAVGLTFTHDAGLDGSCFMPEVMGSGGALFDADSDGDLDVLLLDVGSHAFPWRAGSRVRLFLQDAGRFRDASASSGLDFEGLAMGAATGDVDGDGDSDVFVTGYGPDALFRNEGGGHFTDVTSQSPDLADGRWGSSAAFLDYDLDGQLDLFVATYLAYDPAVTWVAPGHRAIYCAPDSFPGSPDRLFHNEGGGRFTDVSEAVGITAPGKGLGVVTGDFTGDDLPDVFVANDGEPNALWVQQADGTFRDEAMVRGCALDGQGRKLANMGIASGDLDGDEHFDLFVTHLDGETNTLWSGAPGGTFRDATQSAGLASPSLPFTGFGAVFADVDDDGGLDVLAVNGRVSERGALDEGFGGENRRDPGQLLVRPPTQPPLERDAFRVAYGQGRQLFVNDGHGRFTDASSRCGALGQGSEVGRGLAAGDVDGDGDLDLLVTNAHGRARILRNDAPKAGSWLLVRAIDPALHRDAIGATVTLVAGDRRMVRRIDGAGSYLVASDPVAHFGLPSDRYDALEVRWPGGAVERFAGGPASQRVTLRRGEGSSVSPAVAHAHRVASPAHAVNAAALVTTAHQALASGDFRRAEESLDAALRARPRDAGLLSHRALVRRALGDHAGEMSDLDRAVLCDARHVASRINRAQARRAAGDSVGALDDLDTAIASSPSSPLALEERAVTRAGAGDLAGAADDALRCAKLQPANPRPLAIHATLIAKLGRPAEALAELDRSPLTPRVPDLLVLRSDIRRSLGDVQGSQEDQLLLASLKAR